MRPVLGIIIPTKDRYRTLKSLLDSLLKWKYPDFEIIVQDNSKDNTEILEYLKDNKSKVKLKYFYNKRYLSAIENCQFAIENSTAEYICFLGDDDGVISHSVPVARWMKEQNIDSLTCKHGNYFWPEYRVRNHGKKVSMAGTMSYRAKSGSIESLDALKELDVVLSEGALVMDKITRVYHGIVSRAALDKVNERAGTYFPGPVPDMTSSVALSFFVDRHVNIDYPLIVAGFSKNSMAGRGGAGKAHGSIENEKSLPPSTVLKWSEELPRYWAPKTIWPEGALQALKLTGNTELISKVNFCKIYAALFIDIPSYRDELLRFITNRFGDSYIREFNKELKLQRKYNVFNKARENLKIASIIFKFDALLGFTTIYAKDIREALFKLENETNSLRMKNPNKGILEIINRYA